MMPCIFVFKSSWSRSVCHFVVRVRIAWNITFSYHLKKTWGGRNFLELIFPYLRTELTLNFITIIVYYKGLLLETVLVSKCTFVTNIWGRHVLIIQWEIGIRLWSFWCHMNICHNHDFGGYMVAMFSSAFYYSTYCSGNGWVRSKMWSVFTKFDGVI